MRVLWVKRVAAFSTGALLSALLFARGNAFLAVFVGCVNLAWAVADLLPHGVRRLLQPFTLAIDTAAFTYHVLGGGNAAWALFGAGGSLLSWSAGGFLERWSDASLLVQNRYLKRIGGILALGLWAGLSALALQGRLHLSFPVALLLMLVAGVLWLRTISRTLREGNERP